MLDRVYIDGRRVESESNQHDGWGADNGGKGSIVRVKRLKACACVTETELRIPWLGFSCALVSYGDLARVSRANW